MRLWTCRSIAAAVALAAGVTGANGADETGGDPAAVCDNQPVSLVAVRFPCLAPARAFWYSKTYQEDIVPMRDGAGDYTVIVMPAAGIAPVAKVAKTPEATEVPNE